MDYESSSSTHPTMDYASAAAKQPHQAKPTFNNLTSNSTIPSWRQNPANPTPSFTTSSTVYRTIHKISPQPDQANQTTTNNSSRSHQADNNGYRPSRKFAIVLENTQNFNQNKCLRAVANVIGGNNIHYCTRLSGNRVCMYLTNEDFVIKMCDRAGVTVEEEFLPCRRYVSEAKKYIISNCPPELEDETLKSLFEEFGRIVSAPQRLKVTVNKEDEDLQHIKTWRRSIYILKHENAPEMPQRMNIDCKATGMKYTLYIQDEEIVCNYCSRPGHTSEKCKWKLSEFPGLADFSRSTTASSRLTQQRKMLETIPPSNEAPTLMPIFSSQKSQPSTASTLTPQTKAPEKETLLLTSETSKSLSTSSFWGDPIFNSTTDIIKVAENIQESELPPTDDEDMDLTDQLTSNELYDLTMKDTQKPKRQLTPDKVIDGDSKKSRKKEDEVESSSDDQESTSSKSNDPEYLPSSSSLKKKKKLINEINELITQGLKFNPIELTEDEFKTFLTEARGHQNSKKIADKHHIPYKTLISKLYEGLQLTKSHNLARRLQRAHDALLGKF